MKTAYEMYAKEAEFLKEDIGVTGQNATKLMQDYARECLTSMKEAAMSMKNGESVNDLNIEDFVK